ncbi:MAG: hypothetical protein [Wendovervirus sonii]|uniref:Uncharacterized protein n=1 Tax=phage Lak_Megaphage_Sonny TaxID=3109229 RepID=A0ABZ0Z5A7_9CAUD|nr:MAG: hypothetical protein [phage Lak_Megaphage_Sonny]
MNAQKFLIYELLRRSGIINMLDIVKGTEITGLSKDEYIDIIQNYGKYAGMYKDAVANAAFEKFDKMHKLFKLYEMKRELERNIENSRMRVQDDSVKMYLNGLFRNADSRPLIYDNKVPEIYVLYADTTISLGWYMEYDDAFYDRQHNIKMAFNNKNILGWCYKSELFVQH